MPYDFETLKGLYDRYDIKYSEQIKCYQIIDKKTNIAYAFDEGIGSEKVKFAHAWVIASVRASISDDPKIAFDEEHQEKYYEIMAQTIQMIQAAGRLPKLQAYMDEALKKNGKTTYLDSIIVNIYGSEKAYKSFEVWSRSAAKETTLDNWVNQSRGL